MFKAIIIGGTGATGKQLLIQLIRNQNCELVTSIGRRPVLDGEKNDKLMDIVVDSLFKLTATEKYWKEKLMHYYLSGAKNIIHDVHRK